MAGSDLQSKKSMRNKVRKSSKTGQDQKTLNSIFAYILTAIAKVQFLERRLDTGLHPNLRYF